MVNLHEIKGAGMLVVSLRGVNIYLQELIKGSLYLPYLTWKSALFRVYLLIERLPWEIKHTTCFVVFETLQTEKVNKSIIGVCLLRLVDYVRLG